MRGEARPRLRRALDLRALRAHLEAVRAVARRAAELGIPTEHLRVATKRPVRALLQVVRERDAGLLVFGPDLSLVRGRTFRRAAARIRRDAACLVWVAPDG